MRIGNCVRLLRIDRAARVLEVIESPPAHVRILKLAEIDPYMRVLVTEKRRKVQEFLAEKLTPAGRIIRARPFGPSLGLHRMRRRAEREQVDHHRFVVAAPVVLEKTFFGRPAETDGVAVRLGPLPIDAGVDLIDQTANLRFLGVGAVEIRLIEKRAGQQDRGVDRRELAILEPLPGLHVQKVVEKTLVTGRAFYVVSLRRIAEEAQRSEDTPPSFFARDIPALDRDRIAGKPETDGCDARIRRRRIPIGNQSVFRVRRIPEEAKRPFLQLDQERIDDRTHPSRRRLDVRSRNRIAAVAISETNKLDR